MNLFALFAALAAILAPSAAVLPDPAYDVSVSTPVTGASAANNLPNEARLVFEVQHKGMEVPALLTFDGDSVHWVHAVTLKVGPNTLIDDTFPVGKYSIALQNVMTAGGTSVDLGDCAHGMTLARMNTTFETTRFAIGVGGKECLPAQG